MDGEKLKVITGKIKRLSEALMKLTADNKDLYHIYALTVHIDTLVFSLDSELKERKHKKESEVKK
jgi:hypothetical protein